MDMALWNGNHHFHQLVINPWLVFERLNLTSKLLVPRFALSLCWLRLWPQRFFIQDLGRFVLGLTWGIWSYIDSSYFLITLPHSMATIWGILTCFQPDPCIILSWTRYKNPNLLVYPVIYTHIAMDNGPLMIYHSNGDFFYGRFDPRRTAPAAAPDDEPHAIWGYQLPAQIQLLEIQLLNPGNL